MNSKIKTIGSGIPGTRRDHVTGSVVPDMRRRVFSQVSGSDNALEMISNDPIDLALLAITHHDFLTTIQNSPVLGELVNKYTKNWEGILSRRGNIDAMLAYMKESILPDRIDRAGFDPGYIKILLFIQDKYHIYKNPPR